MMKRILPVLIAMLAFSAGAETFETEDYFSITLPDGWVRTSDDVLVSYAEFMDESAAGEEVQYFDYGFQLADESTPLAYPCILVQVQHTGRFSTGDMERFAEEFGGEDVSLNDTKTLFVERREQGGVHVLVGRQLTEYGFIELKGFAAGDDAFEQYEPVFREAFSSLQMDELIRYKPQITDNAPVIGTINIGKVVVILLQSILVGGVLALIYSVIKNAVKRSLKRA